MPYKANEARRHKMPPGALPSGQLAGVRLGAPATGQPDGVSNAGGSGSLAFAQTDRRGRSCTHSDIAIGTGTGTGHLVRMAFGRPWRRTEGLLRSLTTLLGLDIAVPGHTTFSRRKPVHVVIDAMG